MYIRNKELDSSSSNNSFLKGKQMQESNNIKKEINNQSIDIFAQKEGTEVCPPF